MIEPTKTRFSGDYLVAALLMLCAVSFFADSPPSGHQRSELALNQIHCEREITARGIAACIDRFEAARRGSKDLRVRPG
jgi:hypothetical protein